MSLNQDTNMSEILDLKKTLKTWENAFFKQHNNKPDKSDIERAPLEIRECYAKYSKMKKETNVSLKQNLNITVNKDDSSTKDTSVWGTEYNRNVSGNDNADKDTEEIKQGGFLDKIADRMFQNSKMMSAKKLKTPNRGIFSPVSTSANSETHLQKKSLEKENSKCNEPDEPFNDETSNKTSNSSQIKNNISGDLVINSFGCLKSKSLSNVSCFTPSPSRSLKPKHLSDIPDQYCIPSKPRFTVQSVKVAKQKAEEFESKFMNKSVEEGGPFVEINDMEMSDMTHQVGDSLSHNMSKNTFSFSTHSKTLTANCDYIGTPRPKPFKRKSALQEKLEKQSNAKLLNKETEEAGSSKDKDDYTFDSDSDNASSTVKVKPAATKRKAASSVESCNKRQKIDSSSTKNISCIDDAEMVERKPPKRIAAPASKKGINENFVRLNMKSKKYKRKGGGMTGGMYKRKQWKMKMQARSKSYGGKCFICDLEGHWSNNCPEKGKQGNKKRNYDTKPVDETDFLTLKEAALMAKGVKIDREHSNLSTDVKIDEDGSFAGDDEELCIEAEIVRSHVDKPISPPSFEPFYCSTEKLKVKDTPKEMKTALKQFGFNHFRSGQEAAMKRILCGLSTLVVLSTGEGKSLCYQLPAFLYAQKSPCLTLVVSPLVSLMEDQITGLPPGVKGACIHANMTKVQKDGVFNSIAEGNFHFLLVSPEAVVGGAWSTYGSFPGPDKLPPISFVCIDEAHCLSEWSHNFRPSYLRLCKVLREVYGVKCFLGLTATATKSTAADVAKHLGIEDDEDAIIRGSPVPKNLLLSVSRDINKDEALINLLQGERFASCHSIIIYCTRREQANRIATYIRTCLQTPEESLSQKVADKSKKKRLWSAECYHAGLTSAQRKRVQKAFMTSKLRVVVATVAFGMGLDKSDVRAVIHYNLPKSFESYVQEIGRAGRDRQLSHCHLFLDPEGKDLNELRRHTHGNTVDRFTLRKLLQRIFMKCKCKSVHGRSRETREIDDTVFRKVEYPSRERICRGHERAICIEDCVMNFDVREEGIYTLLCYLELHPLKWVEILSPVYTNCKIQCYGGPTQLQAISKKCPPLAVAIAKKKIEGEYFATSNSIDFPVVEISDSMGWDSAPVKRELRQLQWTISSTTGGPMKSGVMVEFCDLGFHFRSPGDLTDDELDNILDFLHHRVTKQEKNELFQLDLLSEALRSVSFKSYWMCADDGDQVRSDKLKTSIEEFFDAETKDIEDGMNERTVDMPQSTVLDQLLCDIRQFYNLYGKEHTLTGRVIARIFHGIGSPCFPVETWCRVRRFWRSHLHIDFNLCLKISSQELIKIR